MLTPLGEWQFTVFSTRSFDSGAYACAQDLGMTSTGNGFLSENAAWCQ